jgi:hypothetical protein
VVGLHEVDGIRSFYYTHTVHTQTQLRALSAPFDSFFAFPYSPFHFHNEFCSQKVSYVLCETLYCCILGVRPSVEIMVHAVLSNNAVFLFMFIEPWSKLPNHLHLSQPCRPSRSECWQDGLVGTGPGDDGRGL